MTTRAFTFLALLLTGFMLAAPMGAARAQDKSPVAVAADYRLGSGDKVRVNVFGEPQLTGEFLVSGSGKIALPLIGEVQAAGLTTREFQTAVESALKEGYLKEPKVNAEVLNYRPFYIMGEVTQPGEYPYTNGLTVLNAVATARGFTYRANTKQVFVRHANELAEHRESLTSTTVVAPGDTIRITERLW